MTFRRKQGRQYPILWVGKLRLGKIRESFKVAREAVKNGTCVLWFLSLFSPRAVVFFRAFRRNRERRVWFRAKRASPLRIPDLRHLALDSFSSPSDLLPPKRFCLTRWHHHPSVWLCNPRNPGAILGSSGSVTPRSGSRLSSVGCPSQAHVESAAASPSVMLRFGLSDFSQVTATADSSALQRPQGPGLLLSCSTVGGLHSLGHHLVPGGPCQIQPSRPSSQSAEK